MPEVSRWTALSAALDALLDLEPLAREAELARIASEDPAFAAELAELLRAESETGLLEHGVAQAAPDLIEQLAREPAMSNDAGLTIGCWRLLRELGHGGMGTVWLAERSSGDFAQLAALKRLRRGMDSEELLRRFSQERRILAALSHPNIARLLDGGIDAQGRPWYAMEYVEGEPITVHARRSQLGLRARLMLMRSVCATVAHAQGRLVVHRDLKPSNILVDAGGEPHLLDFGIAKLLADSDDPALTSTGLRLLSPAYAAPEQILGQPVSTATDVYALGLLLFELLVGQLPHRRGGGRPEALAQALAHETTDRPSHALRIESADQAERAWGPRERERERIAREISGDLDRIVLTALRREPERRYASAAALGDDLERFLDGRPIRARADTAGYRMRKFAQRHRVGVVATLLVLLSLLGGLGAALWQAAEAEAQATRAQVLAQEAEAQAQRAERQARRAEQVKDFLIGLLDDAAPQRARSGMQMRVAELVQEAVVRLDRDLADAPEARAELRITLGDALVEFGDIEAGREQIEAGIAELRILPDADPAALARGLGRLAIFYNALGRADESERLVREGIGIFERLPGDHALERIQLRTSLAKQASLRKDLELAETLYREILEERRALIGADDSRLAVDWNNLAAVALRRDRYREADTAYAEALRLLLSDPASPESRQAWVRAGLGAAKSGLGDYAAAEQEFRTALEVAERTLHPDHSIVASVCHVWSAMLRQQRRYDEALELSLRADAIFEPQHHTDEGSAELQLGLILLERGNLDRADAVLADAERHIVERRSREDTHYWHTLAARALIDRRRGDREAGARLDAVLRGFEDSGLQQTMAYGEALLLRAEVALQDRDARRPEWQARARDVLRDVLGERHPRVLALR